MAGSVKCEPDCTCRKHRKHAPDCTCGRHRRDPATCSYPCQPGCTCGRHRPQVRDRKCCAPDCTCARHVGDHNSYDMLHRRVRETRGKATEHACVRCDAQAREWAQLHTEDGLDIWADYVPMCVSCHRRYDDSPERHAAISRSWTPERRAALGERTKRLIAEGKMGWALYHRPAKVTE